MDAWRDALYPLGFVAKLLFGWRFLHQWIASERQHESVVTRRFWHFSVWGNALFCIHACLQGQAHVGIVQALNLVIAWRNLQLMQVARQPWRLWSVFIVMGAALASTCTVFWLQGHWFRIPFASTIDQEPLHWLWHLLGSLGVFLFASRFWIQWWHAEKQKKSELTTAFWALSVSGSVLSIAYFAKIGDWVNLVSPLFGLVPYMRNLQLIYGKYRRVPHKGVT